MDAAEHTLARAEQLHGKELSYNNILDTDAAWGAVAEFHDPACVIVKHTNPCGTAIAGDVLAAYKRAHDCDPSSAYGGVVALNRPVTLELVAEINARGQFVEVMIAPEYELEALELLMQKKNVRLLKTGAIRRPQDYGMEFRSVEVGCSYRRTTRSPRSARSSRFRPSASPRKTSGSSCSLRGRRARRSSPTASCW